MGSSERNILILGQHGGYARALQADFAPAGAMVHVVHDEQAALAMLRDLTPELVLLDFVTLAGAALRLCAAFTAKTVESKTLHPLLVAIVPTEGLREYVEKVRAASAGFDLVLETPLDNIALEAVRECYERRFGNTESVACSLDDIPEAIDTFVYAAEEVMEEFGLDAEDVAILYAQLVNVLPQELEEMQAALVEGRLTDLARMAHSLAGSSLKMLAHGPEQTVQDMERCAQAQNTAALNALWKLLETQCSYVLAEIRKRLS